MESMAAMGSSVVSTTDPTSMLNNQLANALSTLGDAQFWEETISPATIRNELSACDPSNPNSTPILSKGMKWLLASISKGRDVSDFYPHVVKLVGATSLEVRKMVYMYLVQYADCDATTRELSLLSINSFQRGLADHEQLIRALALRVLSSIRIADILQIQILGVQKCAKDRSPYVRKCAANALSKLSPRCDVEQREMLLEIMKSLLDTDNATMVLSSCLIAFHELCPERLDLLHTSFRKICHLLTDMDEWGQVVIIDILARYCRKFFKEPRNWRHGTAEKIDRERRVRRKMGGISSTLESDGDVGAALDALNATTSGDGPSNAKSTPQKVKRRVVQKGFYSDEEDGSTEEEVYVEDPSGPAISTAAAMRQRNIMGLPGVASQPIGGNLNGDEDMDMDEDHKLLMQASMSLLKSRNAGVVLGVCSLMYYCGASSVKARSAIGKALVRIHRGRREIQYVVLTSIRTLVNDCPSAFAPFLNDFFVKALDPPHTRIIKIDILVSLALEPAAIEAVLKELRTYTRNGDQKFVCASIRAVGRVAELARIVYDRHGQTSGDMAKERKTANRIALDCLYGLSVVTQTCENRIVVGEAVCVMNNIMTMLLSDAGATSSLTEVEDPNGVQGFAVRRIILLLVNSLSNRVKKEEAEEDADESDEEDGPSKLEKVTLNLPPRAVSAAISFVGLWMANLQSPSVTVRNVDEDAKSKMRVEILRLIDRAFTVLDALEKGQGVHFASRLLASSKCGTAMLSSSEKALCEHILSMGRVDVNPDVKDRARFESGVLQAAQILAIDTDGLDILPPLDKSLTIDDCKRLLLSRKPQPSFLAVEDENETDKSSFRFGTLSSLMGHRARGTYLPLPPWSKKNSPKSLRDPVEEVKEKLAPVSQPSAAAAPGTPGFYGSDSESGDDSSSSDSSSSDSSDGGQNADSESDSDQSDDDSSSSSDDNQNMLGFPASNQKAPQVNGGFQDNLLGGFGQPAAQPFAPQAAFNAMQPKVSTVDDGSSSDGSGSSSSSSSSDDDYNGDISSTNVAAMKPKPMQGDLLGMGGGWSATNTVPTMNTNASSSVADDLKGLELAPIVVDQGESKNPDSERDSSEWTKLVRPELCGGLSVKARYLRGPTREREIQLKGLDAKNPAIVCLQLQFANRKTDSGTLRKVRILQRPGSHHGVALKKALCPPEIMELKQGQMANATLCLEFAAASSREGDMVARLEIKTSTGGSVPVEVKPSLCELLVRPQNNEQLVTNGNNEFDTAMKGMQGFGRVTSKFAVNPGQGREALPSIILKHAALTLVGGTTRLAWSGDHKLRLIGMLPASSDLVLVLIHCDPSAGQGNITVCCDNAVAVNSIMAVIKKAVSV